MNLKFKYGTSLSVFERGLEIMGKSNFEYDHESQIILVVRHAHRNIARIRDMDNGLSEKGLAQAKRIRKFVEKCYGRKKPIILSSPKKRCIETVSKIATRKKVDVGISELLDEGGEIQKKVEKLLLQMTKVNDSMIILCSHGDIIPHLLESMTNTYIELSKGGMARIERKQGQYILTGLFQDFDFI